jgi:hypothetical protein
VPSKTGLRSYFDLRNDWSGPEWGIYNSKPADAARITCAHEFFHSIQYSMGHDDEPSYIDYFSGAWLEGTAVLMEDLAFPDIDDYTQYLYGQDGYFGNPLLSVLSDDLYTAVDMYANAVVAMYLYWRAFPSPSISFIRDIFERNEEKLQEFNENISASASNAGKSWTGILHSFHVSSFFSGTRADASVFFPDAPLLAQWYYSIDEPDASQEILKSVKPYAMQTYAIRQSQITTDTLGIKFTGDASESSGNWSSSVILTDSNGIFSVLPLGFSSENSGVVNIPFWGRYDEAVIIVTNAHPEYTRNAVISFSNEPLENKNPSSTYDIYPNPVLRQTDAFLRIEGKDIVNVTLYSIDGRLVANADIWHPDAAKTIEYKKDKFRFEWKLCAKNGKPVSPGTYFAIVGYRDKIAGKIKKCRSSFLVLP